MHTTRTEEPLPVLTTLLAEPHSQFVVVSDTHLMDAEAPHAGEFTSRRRQNERVATAMRVVAGLAPVPLVHLGDLVQDYPENPTHAPLLAEAVRQVRQVAPESVFAPGNTDIGDKPDPSSPAAWASSATLAAFARATGAPWSSLRMDGAHVIVLAASLLNSGLPEEAQQWEWLTEQLNGPEAGTRVLCLHYPIFWRDRHDPDLGNYDVLAEPGRSRLLEIIADRRVAVIFTGHSHFAFLNRIGAARCFGVPSTSFTRPGFSELFSSPAPPDRGRDDVPKLGLLLVRNHDDGLRTHLLRTAVLHERHATAPEARLVLTGGPRDLPTSRLGVVLRHSLATYARVPDTFPSVRPQPVRNDYPLLALIELGAHEAVVPGDDFTDPDQTARLSALHDEGVTVTARLLCRRDNAPPPRPPRADRSECILLDHADPGAQVLDRLAASDRQVRLSTLVRTHRPGAELPRWRYGFTTDEALRIDRVLADKGIAPQNGPRLLVAASDLADRSWRLPDSWSAVGGVDVVYPLTLAATLADLVEAYLRTTMAGCGFLVDTLTELDRTLDPNPGLLDRAGNPRPAFHALTVLNSVLHGRGAPRIIAGSEGFTVFSGGRRHVVDLRRDDDSVPHTGQEVIRLADGFACLPRPGLGPWVEFDRS